MLRSIMSKLKGDYRSLVVAHANMASIAKTAEYRAVWNELRSRQPDNIALDGFKAYSQNDEDGIIASIFKRVPHQRAFMEIGVQDGRECNTHLLLIDGWRGAWIEADPAMCGLIRASLGAGEFPGRFRLVEEFARPANVAGLYRDTCQFIGVNELDLFSLDIDSNDLFVLRGLLSGGCRPSVICLEYNAAFPPPIRVAVEHSPGWAYDDYYGASLQAFADTCDEHGYVLLTCSVVGSNAFFIRTDHANLFKVLPIEELWQPLRSNITSLPGGHAATMKFARDALNR